MANGRSAAPRAPLFIDPRAMRGTNPKRRCSTSSSSSTTRRFSPRAKRRVGRCLTYVQEEFESHLKCGRLELGFLRVRCEGCHAEKLVAFSCKRRGFCPSCGARRKAETAALLADEVLPRRPLRQWVLSLPFALRFLLAAHPRALAEVLGIVYRAISGYVLRKARLTHANGQTGAVTLIQRFGSALNLNIHFHMLFLDGAYLTNTRPPVFRRIGAPSAGELQDLLERIAERIGRALERKGLLARDCENSYLTLDPASGGAMDDLIAHLITYRVDHERVAVPEARRVAVEREIRILGVLTAVHPDVAKLHVRLVEDHDLAGLIQELDRIRLSRFSRQARRHAVRGLALQVLSLLLRGAIRIGLRLPLGRELHRRLRRHVPAVAPVDFPDAAPIRKLRERRPLLRRGVRGGRLRRRLRRRAARGRDHRGHGRCK